MPAWTTREQARERRSNVFMTSLDKVIPPDQSTPMKGSTFSDWEDQAAEMRKSLISTLLEERAALEENAQVGQAGCCPSCGSDNV